MATLKAAILLALVACSYAVDRLNLDSVCSVIYPDGVDIQSAEVGECRFECSKRFLKYLRIRTEGNQPDGSVCKSTSGKTCQDGHCISEEERQVCLEGAKQETDCVYHCEVSGHHHHVHFYKEDGAECHVHRDLSDIHITSYGGKCLKGVCIKDHEHGHDDDINHHDHEHDHEHDHDLEDPDHIHDHSHDHGHDHDAHHDHEHDHEHDHDLEDPDHIHDHSHDHGHDHDAHHDHEHDHEHDHDLEDPDHIHDHSHDHGHDHDAHHDHEHDHEHDHDLEDPDHIHDHSHDHGHDHESHHTTVAP